MTAYILRRLLLIVPTMIGILLVTFVVVQFAPGGPVERIIAQLTGTDVGATARFTGGGSEVGAGRAPGAMPGDVSAPSKYRGAQGLDPEFIKSLEQQFGFDKPAYERFLMLMWNYLRFDFGESYFRDTSVLQLVAERLPVSISLGLWMTLISYAISIPLGIRKAVEDGSRFAVWTSTVIVIGYAIPGFLFAVFRNAMLIIIAGFPGAFISSFFAGSLLIETIFSLEGLGLLGFESIMNRDYPVVFATVYIFSLMGLVINLVSDLTYTWVDPRIDFETREV